MRLPGFEPGTTGPKPAMLPGYTTASYKIKAISSLINFSSRVKLIVKNIYAAGTGASAAPSLGASAAAASFASAAAAASAASSLSCFS